MTYRIKSDHYFRSTLSSYSVDSVVDCGLWKVVFFLFYCSCVMGLVFWLCLEHTFVSADREHSRNPLLVVTQKRR